MLRRCPRSSHSGGVNGGGQLSEKSVGFVPVYAGISDALPLHQWFAWYQRLRARHQIAFDHHAEDATISGGNLCSDIAADQALTGVVFVAVGVAAIDHDAWRNAGFLHLLSSLGHSAGLVVRRLPATAEDDVTVRIAPGKQNRRLPCLRVPEEGVRIGRGDNRLNCNLHVARGSVLEADGTRKP